MKLLNLLLPFVDFLYVMQLEEYYSHLYLRALPRFYFRRSFQKREKLAWTSRIQTTFLISSIFFFYPILLSSTLAILDGYQNWWLIILVIFGSILLIPIWILAANLILSPVYGFIKKRIQIKASKHFISQNSHTKVIMVSGSFGKTTTKNFLYQILQTEFRTQMLPGNINTPIGIAVWVLNKLQPSTELLIVEADSDFKNKVKQCCQITPPDIAILTNIGDQHLVNFGGKFKNLATGLSEIFVHAKPDAKLITNQETKAKLQKLTAQIEERIISLNNNSRQELVKLSGFTSMGAKESLRLCLEVLEQLEVPHEEVKEAIQDLTLPDRRHNFGEMFGFKMIDDSYNISFTTAKSGVESAQELAKKEKLKLILITGGIPDLAGENADYNIKYGEWLAETVQSAELVILESILQKDLLVGLADFKNITKAESMQDAWEKIVKKFDPKKSLVLMQPELNDLYY